VSFQLARESEVRLELLDLQGRARGLLAQGRYPAGEHAVAVPRGGLVAGVYWLRLSAAGETRQARFVVLP
jgi:hypothetical protein